MTLDVAGLVLAAGAGRRMGGPKALLRLSPDAPTLAERAVGVVRAGGCERVVVVVGAQAERAGRHAARTGAEVVHAADWAEGMSASLSAGLQALAPDPTVEAALVMLVDLPDVEAPVIERVLARVGGEPATALVRAAYEGRPGHPVVLGRAHWPEVVEHARGDAGARAVLTPERTDLVECGDLATGRDIDRPRDL